MNRMMRVWMDRAGAPLRARAAGLTAHHQRRPAGSPDPFRPTSDATEAGPVGPTSDHTTLPLARRADPNSRPAA
jgi:hypothetical protein